MSILRLLRTLGEFLDTLAFDVATFRHLPDEGITSHPPMWLFDQYERVDRARWQATVAGITAAEWGTVRALARAFGKPGEKLEALPTYDEMLKHNLGDGDGDRDGKVPAWMKKFEEANKDKGARQLSSK